MLKNKSIPPDIINLFILLTGALLLWLTGLGNLPLRDWDEGYYGTVSKDMFFSGNWLYPTYLGESFLLKPPLIFWLISISYHWGKINEFTTRFPCAFLSALSVPLLYLIGREIFKKRSTALLTALIYLTLLPVVRHGRLAMLDGMINTFLLLSFWSLLKSRKSPSWSFGIGLGLGLIALSKGTLAIAIGFILIIFLIVNQQTKILKYFAFWGGMIVGFLPITVWYGLQIHHYGDRFIQVHFLQQNFDRLATAVEGNSGSYFYYLIELIKYTVPWLFFLPTALVLAWKKRHLSWGILILVGMVTYFGLITFMGTKLPWYIMPIYPFFAIAIAAKLDEYNHFKPLEKKIFSFLFLFSSLAALLGTAYLFKTAFNFLLVLLGITLTLTLGLTGLNFDKNRRFWLPILIIGLYLTLLLFVNSSEWIWELNEAFSVKPVAHLIKRFTPENRVVYTSFDYGRTSLDFYSDRKVVAVDDSQLNALQNDNNYLLLDQSTLDNLSLPDAKILGQAEGFTLVVSQPNI